MNHNVLTPSLVRGLHLFVIAALLLALALGVHPGTAQAQTGSYLYVSSEGTNEVLRYDGATGAPAPAPGQSGAVFVSAGSGGLTSPQGLAFGPDGNLYVSSYGTNQVLRYNWATGAFIDAFVSAGSGGLTGPRGLVFGPDGNLYVSSEGTNEVLRYNGTTGAFIDVFGDAHYGDPSWLLYPFGLVFGGPSGNLHVASQGTSFVLRYNGTTGAFIDFFASACGLKSLVFGPDGNLYVSVFCNGSQVLRFNGTTGAFIDAFVPTDSGGLDGPWHLVFGPDGNLYVSSYFNQQVLRYNGTTGAFINAFVPTGSGGLLAPTFLIFGPVPQQPTITKAFNPATVFVGLPSTVTFTITNPNAGRLTGLAFVDNLPTNLVVATPPNVTNTCGGTVVAAAGGSSISLSGGTLAGGKTCAVSVNVVSAVVGSYENATGAVSSAELGAGSPSNKATLMVKPVQPRPVGGYLVPVNRLELLAPWLGLAALASLATLGVVLVSRRRA